MLCVNFHTCVDKSPIELINSAYVHDCQQANVAVSFSAVRVYCLLYGQYTWPAREKINDFKFVMNERTVPKHCTIRVEDYLAVRCRR